MSRSAEDLAFGLLALDRSALRADDFPTLSRALVDWALQAGLAGACVVTPDEQGWLHPGPAAGDGVEAYLHQARLSIRDSYPEGRGAFDHAWRTVKLHIADLTSLSGQADVPQSTGSVARWRTGATVPLANAHQCFGLLQLFSQVDGEFARPEWTAALAHIGLIAGVVLDRLHLSAEQNRLRELSLYDALTGLPNMAALSIHLAQAKARSLRADVPLVIGLLDLDKFKPVNDLFGHEMGDDVLREIAVRLRHKLRASDFVARRSGDEFVIVLEGARDPERTLPPLLKRLHAALTQPVSVGGTSWQCGVSLGLCVWPGSSSSSPDDALSEADRALRKVKTRAGKSEIWWSWAAADDGPQRPVAYGQDNPGLYSPDSTMDLVSLSEQLERNATAIVDDFYQRLSRLPKCKRTLEALSGPELQHLKAQQMRNLFALADPGLTEGAHRATALRVGRIHAMVGLDREELVRSRGILASAVDRRLGRSASREAAQIFAQRLNRDLAFQAEAYQQFDEKRLQALSDIAHVAWNTDSYADLIARVVEILGHCDEIAGCAISRPDRHGVLRVESTAGRILAGRGDEVKDGEAGTPHELPLLLAAWHSGNIERCINVSTDPAMTAWTSLAMREGLRSGVAIPLRPAKDSTFAVLILYSTFPGGYSSAEQLAFIDLLQTLLALAISRCASDEGAASAIPHSTRNRWKTLLRSDSLQMYCQPIVELKTGRVTKVEILARLDEGSRLLAPYEFFPALGSDDFLELYVRGLNDALSHRAAWLRDGIDLGVSLNLPSSALLDTRYFEATRQALDAYGYPPRMLTLEILEAEALPSDARVSLELARFKSLGIALAEDDLGAGHSSLSRLRQMPFDWIKIDRSIVSLAEDDASTVLSFIYQLTRLGHSLGKSVIVEGVESEALLESCRILNVDAAQGYVIASPMPLEQLPEWIRSRPAWTDTTDTPRSAMGKLARLLIWEERLHLAQGDLAAVARLFDVIRAPVGCTSVPATPTLSQVHCRACPLSAFFTAIDASPLGDATMTQALIDAAVLHGPRSPAYQDARQRFVSAFSVGTSTAYDAHDV
ncbi:EAL domain-containing protein [Paraburkholderia mimosarum]|uniref:EAL domain-containing protein n=1 Tax=Paraburkholderia mimosarum TaxID=312026 RepID=UPI0009DF767D|nr:EAL domain-containing protein [Paraburkholderia mimosarum]